MARLANRCEGGVGPRESFNAPFRCTGKLTTLTLAIERPQLTPADEKLLMEAGPRNNEARE